MAASNPPEISTPRETRCISRDSRPKKSMKELRRSDSESMGAGPDSEKPADEFMASPSGWAADREASALVELPPRPPSSSTLIGKPKSFAIA
ncbi:hypothetical protein BRARA_J01929 [Brassica rapa]|uniref:Uncharacterized protein n=1 Tax=Brassica campestris TaxID=3711 RepID=A0A397XLT0_BRACM|nr:hypothetical protein BRARA_J01929 [Brassica rapa]